MNQNQRTKIKIKIKKIKNKYYHSNILLCLLINKIKASREIGKPFFMEHTGLEPVTSTLPVWRAPNCANAP